MSGAAEHVGPGPDLLVVVVNYRTPRLTIDCLASLAGEVDRTPGLRVVVVDNHSPDDSMDRIESAVRERGWSEWCRAIRTERNGGFAYGNNRGIEAGRAAFGRPRHVLHLNSDTVVHAGCLRACLEVMDSDATIGAMSCRLLNGDGSVQNVARRFPTPVRLAACALSLPWKLPGLFEWADTDDRGWDRDRVSRDVDWLGGAFLLMRGDLMERIGGFSEAFFFYGEDIELCHRIARAGYRRRYECGPTTTHLGGGSSDPTRLAATLRSAHYWTARYGVQRLCYGRLAAWAVRAVDTATVGLRLLALRVARRGGSARYEQLLGAWRVLSRPLGPVA